MNTVIVSLISRQTLPNVLFLKEMEGEEYILVSTAEMEMELQVILSIADLPKEKTTVLVVKAYDLDDVLLKLRNRIVHLNKKYIINFTGGTKIMALGAFQFFTKLNSDFYYLPIEKNAYQKISPTFEPTQKFQFKITVLDYLKCYKIKVENATNRIFEEAMTTRYFDLFVDGGLTDDDFLARKLLRKKTKNYPINIQTVDYLQNFLEKLNFQPLQSGFLTEHEAKYLTAGWLEEYIYSKIKKTLGLSDDQIKLNVSILAGEMALNELDIIFIKNNQLHVVECKTTLDLIKLQLSTDASEVFYKLGTQIKNMGLTAVSFLFTLKNLRQKKSDKLLQEIADRAEQNNVMVIDRKILIDDYQLTQKINAL